MKTIKNELKQPKDISMSKTLPDQSITSAMIIKADGTIGQDVRTGTGIKTAHIQKDAVTKPKIRNNAITSNKIREADGTTGQNPDKGAGIKTPHIQDEAVTTAKIGHEAVTEDKIANGAVTELKLMDDSVTSSKIKNGNVGTGEIATGAVTESKLEDHSVTSAKIKDGSVSNAQIADGSVTESKLGDNSVTSSKIRDGSVGNAQIADGAVTELKLMDNSVSSSKIKDGNVGTDEIATGAVTESKLEDHSVTLSKIKDGNVGTSKLANGAVTESKLGDNSVTSTKIKDGNVGTSKLANGAVTESKLGINSISSAKIKDGSVGNAEIANGAVTYAKLANYSVTYDKLDSNTRGKLVTGGDNHKHSATEVGALPVTGGTISGNLQVKGNIGIGTPGPGVKLHVGGDGAILGETGAFDLFGANDNVEHNGYLKLINSDKWTSAWGLKAGGILVSDSYAYANPGKNDLIVKGNVGIGTTNPGAKLDVKGDIFVREGDSPRGTRFFFKSSWNCIQAVSKGGGTCTLMLNPDGGAVVTKGYLIVEGGKSGYIVDHFINKVGKSLEQGDIVVLGKNQASLYYGLDSNIPVPEVDLTDKAYDSRVCGIVAEIAIDVNEDSEKEVERNSKSKNNIKKKKEVNKTKIGIDQKGMMVTLGAYAHCKVDADIASIEVGDLLTTSTTKGHAQKVLDKSKAVGAILGKALAPLKKGKGKIPVLAMMQ